MCNLARSNLLKGGHYRRGSAAIAAKLVLTDAHNQHADRERPDVLLVFQVAIDRDENIKAMPGEAQWFAIGRFIPAQLMDCLCVVFRKAFLKAWIYAFVKEDAP